MLVTDQVVGLRRPPGVFVALRRIGVASGMEAGGVGKQHRDLRLHPRQGEQLLIFVHQVKQAAQRLPDRRRRRLVRKEAELRLFAVAEEKQPPAAAQHLHEHLKRRVFRTERRKSLLCMGFVRDDRPAAGE
ncbi:hypothetical protein SDC9_208791 [bioreactor metagenome]|uniref:Uncharacterized protein n=1 Tax=bioreactor metagenome TaxID=1076179 RepID=A0A645JCK1_9ZZZZ